VLKCISSIGVINMIALSTKFHLTGFVLAFTIFFLRILAGHNETYPLLIMVPFMVGGWVIKRLETVCNCSVSGK